jgi:phage tail-like protein
MGGYVGEVRRFHHKYRWYVQAADFERAAFMDCSELSAEVAKIEHWEGGGLTPYKEPGRTTFADITLSRGVTNDRDLYDWILEVVDATANTGNVMPSFKKDIDIVQLGRNGQVIRRWQIMGAWPTKVVVGEWNNDDDGVTMESITLTFDTFRRADD